MNNIEVNFNYQQKLNTQHVIEKLVKQMNKRETQLENLKKKVKEKAQDSSENLENSQVKKLMLYQKTNLKINIKLELFKHLKIQEVLKEIRTLKKQLDIFKQIKT